MSGPVANVSERWTLECPGCEQTFQGARCPYCGIAIVPGGYVVRRVLSQADYSRVYLAVGPDGEQVVVRELLYSLAPSAKEIELFEREAAVLARLNHPNIPQFRASFRAGEGPEMRLYLVQAFVAGPSLQERLRQGAFPESLVLRIARQLLEALRYLHSQQPRILHRDIKPANIIQGTGGKVWLVDFGAARFLENNETNQGTFVGTPGYVPFEALGGTIDETTDLYGLGASLLQLATGLEPAACLGPQMQLRPPTDVRMSAALRAFISRLVAPRPKRFDSAADALRALPARTGWRWRWSLPSLRGATRGQRVIQLCFLALLLTLGRVSVRAVRFHGGLLQYAHLLGHRLISGTPLWESRGDVFIDTDGPVQLPHDLLSRASTLTLTDLRSVDVTCDINFRGPVAIHLPALAGSGAMEETCENVNSLRVANVHFERVLGPQRADDLFVLSDRVSMTVELGEGLGHPGLCDDTYGFDIAGGRTISEERPRSKELRFTYQALSPNPGVAVINLARERFVLMTVSVDFEKNKCKAHFTPTR